MYCICQRCGAEIHYQESICPQCGKPLDSRWYKYSSSLVDNAAEESRRIHTQYAEQGGRRKKLLLLYLIPFIVFALILKDTSERGIVLMTLIYVGMTIYLVKSGKFSLGELKDTWVYYSWFHFLNSGYIKYGSEKADGCDYSLYFEGVIRDVKEESSYEPLGVFSSDGVTTTTYYIEYGCEEYPHGSCTIKESVSDEEEAKKTFAERVMTRRHYKGDRVIVNVDRNGIGQPKPSFK